MKEHKQKVKKSQECEECECCEQCSREKEKLVVELEQERHDRLTVLADFINYRKRSESEKEELRVLANKEMLQHIIEVIADFDRAVASNKEVDVKSDFYQGIVLIQQKLSQILERYGIKIMDIKAGSEFDPVKMEAIATAAPTNKIKAGKVLQVFQKGYVYMNSGQVYITAKVVIAK